MPDNAHGLAASDFSFALRGLTWGPWSFTMPARGIVGVLGPNGAGKTSLFHVLLGQPAETRGSLTFGGGDLLNVSPLERRELWAAIPQESPYPEDWTVEAAVSLAFVRTHGFFHRVTAEEENAKQAALARLGLSELVTKRLGQLSSGQRQRVFLCRALLQRSKGMLLDEPTNHLDPPSRRSFWEHLRNLRRDPASPLVVVATHEVEQLEESADYIVALTKHRQLAYAGDAASFWKQDWFSLTFD